MLKAGEEAAERGSQETAKARCRRDKFRASEFCSNGSGASRVDEVDRLHDEQVRR